VCVNAYVKNCLVFKLMYVLSLKKTCTMYQKLKVTSLDFRLISAMHLLTKYISQNKKAVVLLTGEGSDELTQGYLYFHHQPNPEDGDEDSR